MLAKRTASSNVRILHERASKASFQGVLIAVAAVILATLAVTYLNDKSITLDGLVNAQKTNFALWVLNLMPFVFGYIAQYSSINMAREASSLVREQTQELRERADTLEKQANFATTHDQITELPNRALFADRIERAISANSTGQVHFALLVLDLENLKEVQDTLGAGRADLLLKQVATRLGSLANSRDSLARIDSHTFALLILDIVDSAQAERAALIVQKAMEPAFGVDQMKLPLHSSIGIVTYPEHGDDPESLLQRAGVAVYMAGRAYNGYALYAPGFDDHSPRRLTLMGELRQALDKGQFELYHQPKVDIASGKVIGSEALIRWHHARHGFIPPDEFITLAERSRMIRPLTQWVLEHAFGDCSALRNAGFAWTVSVNLSTRDLHDPEFPDMVAGMMARTGIQPDWVILEITESSIMVDPARVLNVVERLHEMGFNLSIDDYGTGYSSLAYLKKLPVSELKIDKSFVMDMLSSENDAIIVRATVDLAHNLGLKVTAEGVETEEALAVLRGYGCDIGQGYLFSKPRPLMDILNWMKSGPWKGLTLVELRQSTETRPAASS
ncbi:MAG: bifunctional diguanylate cyclase/phosphodiesterase [Hydrogenophilales bacterium]|nr:bifunctional diguanylate cyclase/phosphodiesterase [Hydrogenophilales bacterium]